MREALCRQTAEHHVTLKIFGNQNSKAYAQASFRLSLGPCDDFFGNVASTALFDRLSALAAEQSGIPRKDEFEAVVDLCHRAHGRTRGLDAVGLIDGDRRRHPVDFVDLRTVAAFQKLAGVSAERFDVTALSFSVKRVIGKRALPDPEGPVMTVIVPGSMSRSRFRRLFWRAPRMRMGLMSVLSAT